MVSEQGSQPGMESRAIRAEEELAEAKTEISRLKSLIDRDRTGLAAGLDECRKRARAGRWISEGRGSYEWNDDRYRKETGALVNDIVSIADKALRVSGALADQAFHPVEMPDVAAKTDGVTAGSVRP